MLSQLRMAELAAVAYGDSHELEKWVKAVGGAEAKHVELYGDVFVSFLHGVTRYCAFRGSDGWLDWISNILRWREEGVHSGFYHAFRRLSPHLPRAEVWVGHSRGGALAQIAGKEIGGHVVTFGSPKVFTPAVAKEYNEYVLSSIRYTMFGDIVPMVPIFGYEHTREVLRLKTSKEYGDYPHGMHQYLHEMQLREKFRRSK